MPRKDKSRTVFIANVDNKVDAKTIKAVFEPCGKVYKISLARQGEDGKGKRRGFGHIEFKTKEAAKAALAKNRTKIGNRKIYVKKAKEDEYLKRTVFISKVDPETNAWYQFIPLFRKCGRIKSIAIAGDRGYAHVTYERSKSAKKALELTVDDKKAVAPNLAPIVVEKAIKQTMKIHRRSGWKPPTRGLTRKAKRQNAKRHERLNTKKKDRKREYKVIVHLKTYYFCGGHEGSLRNLTFYANTTKRTQNSRGRKMYALGV
jgi:RNA recognition motif-containing protein